MAATAAAHAHLTPVALEALVAGVLVAILVALGLALVYAVVAGSGAWVLMLLLGLLRLAWVALRGGGRFVGAHLHRTSARVREITPDGVPGPRVRPLG